EKTGAHANRRKKGKPQFINDVDVCENHSARFAIDSNQSSSNRKVAAKSEPIAPRTNRHSPEGSVTASTPSNRKSSQPNSRISPEGLRRIVEANKRRAAERRATQHAQATAAQQKSDAGKKTAPAQKGAGKKIPAKRA